MLVSAGFAVKIKISLNPPLIKGDFLNPPFIKGGFFILGGVKFVVHEHLVSVGTTWKAWVSGD
jgi:hypothetical protein